MPFRNRIFFRAAVLLLIVMMSAGALAENVTFNTDSRIYQAANLSSRYVSLEKGTQAELLATRGGWAQIRISGVVGYTNADHLTADEEETPDYSALMKNAKAATVTKKTRVYEKPSTSARSLRVGKGTAVNLLAINGKWALVEKNGCYAYMNAAHVEEKAQQSAPDYDALMKNAQDAVILKNTRVYEKPSTSSRSLKVSAGMKVNLLAVNDNWALVENSGCYAYMDAASVAAGSWTKPVPTPVPTATPAPTATPTPTPVPTPVPTKAPVTADYLNSSKYSNEEKCYLFLTNEMKLNSAAACGILANIRSESSFKPDVGSSYYGLCQWGGGRLSNMKKFCSNNGYEVSSLAGQLYFLEYELEKSYPKILTKLRAVEDSAEGAYEAGYIFCYEYERPAAKATSSVKRGNMAKDTYYPKYV